MLKINGIDLYGYMNVVGVEVQSGSETITKSPTNKWSLKKVLGKIIIQGNCLGDNNKTAAEKLDLLRGVLSSGVIQVNDEYYYVSLALGVNEMIDPSNFNIVFNVNGAGVVGLYPTKPKNVEVTVDGKLVNISFEKGIHAVATRVVYEGQVLETLDNNITLLCENEDITYFSSIYSVSSTGTEGDKVNLSFVSKKTITIPSAPTNIVIKEVVGKYITVGFVKGLNAKLTKAVINGDEFSTYNDSEITVVAKTFDSLNEIVLASVSSDGGQSEFSSPITASSGSNIIPSQPIITDFYTDEKLLTVHFEKGVNAVSTHFVINGSTVFTKDNVVTFMLNEYGKEYTFKARSISSTDGYSDFILDKAFITGKKIVIPSEPYNVLVESINGKVIVVRFSKGINSSLTELMIGGNLYSTDKESIEVAVPEFATEYTLMIRAKSSSDNVTGWVDALRVTSGLEDVTPDVPTNISVAVSGRGARINFVKGLNAKSTQVLIGSNIYSTELNYIDIALEQFNLTYSAKLRSVSTGGVYGLFTDEVLFTTESEILAYKLVSDANKIYSPVDNVNITNNVPNYSSKVELNPTELKEDNINRYSINGSIVNGRLN